MKKEKKQKEQVNKSKLLGKNTAKTKKKKKKKQTLITRTEKLINSFKKISQEMDNRQNVTAEQEWQLYQAVIRNSYNAIWLTFVEAREVGWAFFSKLWSDFIECLIFIFRLCGKICRWLYKAFLWLCDRAWDIAFFTEQHKVKLFMWFSSVVSGIAIVLILASSVSAYEYSYYGKVLGTAKSKQDVYRTIEVLGDKLSDASGYNIKIDPERDIQFTVKYGFNQDVDTEDEILNNLTYMKDLKATGYSIAINNKVQVIMQSEEAAKKLLEDYKNYFAGEKDGVVYNTVRFEEIVEISEVQVLLGDIWNSDVAFNYLLTGKLKEEDASEGPLLNVYSVETASYKENIDYDIDYIDNSSLYVGDTEIITPGIYGTNDVVAEVIRYNGIEVQRTVLSSFKSSNPINAVAYSGTKPIPVTKGSGWFMFPLGPSTEWYCTTYFLEDQGSIGVPDLHKGLDFGVAIGTHVYASDGGVVTFAGYSSGMGYEVIIDHGGLYTSIYGHLDELFVYAGEEVFQGQHIANSGSTGYSTGPHLHFEIRYNDEPVDPGYLVGLY